MIANNITNRVKLKEINSNFPNTINKDNTAILSILSFNIPTEISCLQFIIIKKINSLTNRLYSLSYNHLLFKTIFTINSKKRLYT